MPGYELRRSIGYVIQGHGLFPHRTVAQNIATVPVLLGWDKDRIEARVDELLTLFQLDPAELTGRAIRTNSPAASSSASASPARSRPSRNVLLMDEPFGALDPIIRTKAQEDLLAIQKRFGTTIILVTHDMEEAIHLGDKIAVMDAGKLVQYAKPAGDPGKPGQRASSRRWSAPASGRSGCCRSDACATRSSPARPKASRFPAMPASAMRWPNCCGRAGRRCR